MELTMFLASIYVLRPIAGSGCLVVEQAADAELLSGRSVPACPVPGARGLVAKYTVEPVAVLGGYRGIGLTLSVAVVCPPGIVAALGDAAMLAGEDKAVGTVEQLGPAVYTLPVSVAIVYVADNSRFRLAWVLLLLPVYACNNKNNCF